MKRCGRIVLAFLFVLFFCGYAKGQCTSADILEPGFKFLTSSRGCAPFTVQMQTEYLSSVPGTVYYVDWGDGTPEETYVQTSSAGVVLQHTFPNSPVECGYDVIIDASNTCNPRGSVTPIETQVIVWTNDVISINPQVFRVCQGFAQELQFTDDSDWNCFPRDTRENSEARWIQWIYGTGSAANRIPGIQVNNTSATFPYLNPAPLTNPIYPVMAPGQTTLPIQVPVTAPADIGKEFEITLKNWNQCNPYDQDIKDGNPRNPVNGDLVNGDFMPMVTTARIVVVDAPQPIFQTRAGSITGPVQTTFCIDEDIYFEDLTPGIAGAAFMYSWEFYDNNAGTGAPLATSNEENPVYSYPTAGAKLVRIKIRDANAAGNCEAVYEQTVFISPLVQALIGVEDTNGNALDPFFCQSPDESQVFTVRFTDRSFGTVTPDIRWRWEFYDGDGTLMQESPAGGGYSATQQGPFDINYQQKGSYLTKLIVLDNVTGCTSQDTAWIKININPIADFNFTSVCIGDSVTFIDNSTAPAGQLIKEWHYDIFNDGTTDGSFTSSEDFKFSFPSSGSFPVKLTVISDQDCSSSVVKDVLINPVPEAVITADNLTGCSDLEVTFENQSWSQSLPVDYYEWQVDSGAGYVKDSIQQPSDPSLTGFFTKTFVNTGSSDKIFKVRLLAYGQNGCIKSSNELQVTVTPGASSGFLYTNYSPFNNNCAPVSVDFAVDSQTQSLSPSDYLWEVLLEDSLVYSESTGVQPGFSYSFHNTTGSVLDYNVRLTTSLSTACSGDSTLLIRINPVPSAQFTIDTLFLGCDEVKLLFSSIQKGLSSYQWELKAEGTTIFSLSGGQDNFEYTFDRTNSPLNISTTLITKNLANCISAPVEKNTTIPSLNNLTAAFSLSSYNLVLPDGTVDVINQSTPGNWQYEWDFGNGVTSAEPNPEPVTYEDMGQYVITLTIRDGDCMSSFSQMVNVTSPPPTVDFTYDPPIGCHPLKVNFQSITTNADTYFWEFGDGNTSSLANPQHTYVTPGIYSVSLTVKGKNGENVKAVKSNIIEVVESPFAYFEIQPGIVYIPDMPIFTRNLSVGATSYYWDFGDGTVSDEFEPKHFYTRTGLFDVTLRAYNDYCYDSLVVQGAVSAKSSGRLLVPNAFSPSLSGPGNLNSGDNDVFVPLVADVKEYRLQIFNRWGQMLFEGINQGWTGYFEGKLCPQDVYIFKMFVTFNNGDQLTKVGDVNLIR